MATPMLHITNLNRFERIFDVSLRAEAQPITHEIVSLNAECLQREAQFLFQPAGTMRARLWPKSEQFISPHRISETFLIIERISAGR
jgi:hypothetical protein